MDLIIEWVKKIVFFYIWITAVMHLVPSQKYQKYIRLMGGLLLVVLLVSPILNILYHPEYLLEKISYEVFWQKTDTMKLDLQGLEEFQQHTYEKQWQQMIEEDLREMALQENIEIQEMQLDFTEDYKIQEIFLEFRLQKESGIPVEKIVFSSGVLEYPMVQKLKEKIMNFYELKEEQVILQEG